MVYCVYTTGDITFYRMGVSREAIFFKNPNVYVFPYDFKSDKECIAFMFDLKIVEAFKSGYLEMLVNMMGERELSYYPNGVVVEDIIAKYPELMFFKYPKTNED